MKFKSQVLVGIQFLCLFYFAISGSIPNHWYLVVADLLGIGLGVWAILTMRNGKFSVFPEPKIGAPLIENGPYQFIRHPMYTALLLVCASMTLAQPTLVNGLVFGLLLINQLIKLNYEEGLLKARFVEYEDYMKRTKKLIPYLY
jgi:protein-S-isoprenylcysteine O-methyltransferase Ste14